MSTITTSVSSVVCPVCENDAWSFVREGGDFCRPEFKKTFKLTRCLSCGHIIQNPPPDEQELSAAYSLSENYRPYRAGWKEAHWPIWKILRVWTNRRRLAQIGLPFGRKQMLEVGCGSGDFMVAAHKAGWDVRAVEYNGEMVDMIVKGLGYDVRLGGLSPGLWCGGQFDMVVFWNVIEHVPEPLECLLLASSYLPAGGKVAVSIPTRQTAEHGLWFGQYWANLDLPRHLNFWDESTLSRLFSKAGFDLVEYRTPFIQSAWSYYMSPWLWANRDGRKMLRWPRFIALACLMTFMMPYVAFEAVCGRGMEAVAVAVKR